MQQRSDTHLWLRASGFILSAAFTRLSNSTCERRGVCDEASCSYCDGTQHLAVYFLVKSQLCASASSFVKWVNDTVLLVKKLLVYADENMH